MYRSVVRQIDPAISCLLTVVAILTVLAVQSFQAQDVDRTEALRAAMRGGPARNVILMIGDGMGDSEMTLARNYARGATGRLAMDTLPFTGSYTTYSVEESDPTRPNYVSDSASSGTGWATGSKTSNGRISTSAATGRPLKTILEIAQERGFRVGSVTTAELTDATPAVLAAHVASRTCQGPLDMAACPRDRRVEGGLGSIAEQEIDHRVDVLLGGGRARFDQPTDAGPPVLQRAAAQGYRIVTTAAGLESSQPGERILGLFAKGNMTTEWSGQKALPYPSNVKAPQVCEQNRRPDNEPSVARMTAKAIEFLERPTSVGAGFVLQVEGASIDKENHSANPCGQIGETMAFDAAVQVAIAYGHAHADTLVVVSADHGHTSQIVPLPTDADHPTGLVSVLRTADGSAMAVAYGTNQNHRPQEHTGTQVRLAAMGPQAANVTGLIDQTDVFRLLLRAITAAPAQR